MTIKVDLLIENIGQVVTCAASGGPKRGAAMADVGLIPGGAIAVSGGEIAAVGPTKDVRAEFVAAETIDAGGQVVCPGFVDPHTHVVYAGERIAEFELRIKGATYMEIMNAGGGILSTMKATRAASVGDLVAESRSRLDTMLALGTTTVEVKTGYGLEPESELAMLQAIAALDAGHAVDLVPTFLGAHAVPPEFKGRPDDYLALVIDEMLPRAAAWFAAAKFKLSDIPFFCDIFCEANVFDRAQTERLLAAGKQFGLRAKVHADEFVNLSGVLAAIDAGAISVDHLDVTPPVEIAALAASNTVGVVLPAVNFHLGSAHFADARSMIDAGVALALATDINPGSAPCPSMPLVMALACRYQHLLPAEALNAATINAAHAIGLGHRLGSIEPGKQADLLILNATDYRQLAYEFGSNQVSQVIKRGKTVTSDELRV